MSINITLNFIQKNWSPATQHMDPTAFILAVLPDAYNPACCKNQGAGYFTWGDKDALSDSALRGLRRGNRLSNNNLRSPCTKFTNHLLKKLQQNEAVIFQKPKYPDNPDSEIAYSDIPCITNMHNKIRKMVHDYQAPMTKNHPLFTQADFSTLGECDSALRSAYDCIKWAIHRLAEQETENSLSYAIMLMVITAILQERVAAVTHLFSDAAITRILENDVQTPLPEPGSRKYVPFTDRDYMYKYHIYLYRESSNVPMKMGTLDMQLVDPLHSVAYLTLDAFVNKPVPGVSQISRVFTGNPMLTRADNIVYMAMTDELDYMIYLYFPYQAFNFAPMFFRAGLMVGVDNETGYPQAQKIAITSRELSPEELPYVRGLLKTGGKQITISPSQLNRFLETFRDYPWMEDFRTNILPVLQERKRTWYSINEDEILACSACELEYLDRLRVMLALKSVDSPNDNRLNKFLKTAPPRQTYYLMRPDSKEEKA